MAIVRFLNALKTGTGWKINFTPLRQLLKENTLDEPAKEALYQFQTLLYARNTGNINLELILILQEYNLDLNKTGVAEKYLSRIVESVMKYPSDTEYDSEERSHLNQVIKNPWLRTINLLLKFGVKMSEEDFKNLATKISPLLLAELSCYELLYYFYPPKTVREKEIYAFYLAGKKDETPLETKKTADLSSQLKQACIYLETRLEFPENQKTFDIREDNAIALYSKIAPEDFWMLCQEGQQIKYGPFCYDATELGSLSAIENAYRYMLTIIDEPITTDTLKAIHKRATHQVFNLRSNLAKGEFSSDPDGTFGFFLIYDTYTEKGLEEIRVMEKELKTFNLQDKGLYSIRATPRTLEEVNAAVKKILDRYHHDIKKIREELTGQAADNTCLNRIAQCIQELERTHPFGDGNCRTFTIFLNLLLLQNGFCPTLLHIPDAMDGLDRESFVNQIKQGQLNFRFFIKNKCYPGRPTTEEILASTHSIIINENHMIPIAGATLRNAKSGTRNDFFASPKKYGEDDDVFISSLHWATHLNQTKFLNIFLENKANINEQDFLANTALILAVANDNTSIAKQLLAHPDIDINREGQFDLTAYDIAKFNNNKELMELLLLKGAKDREKNIDPESMKKFGYNLLIPPVLELTHSAAQVFQEQKAEFKLFKKGSASSEASPETSAELKAKR